MKEAKAKTAKSAERTDRSEDSPWEGDELLSSEAAEDVQDVGAKSSAADDGQRSLARRRLEQHLEARRLDRMLRDVFTEDDNYYAE